MLKRTGKTRDNKEQRTAASRSDVMALEFINIHLIIDNGLPEGFPR